MRDVISWPGTYREDLAPSLGATASRVDFFARTPAASLAASHTVFTYTYVRVPFLISSTAGQQVIPQTPRRWCSAGTLFPGV
jgi:hypothetical protein